MIMKEDQITEEWLNKNCVRFFTSMLMQFAKRTRNTRRGYNTEYTVRGDAEDIAEIIKEFIEKASKGIN